ncbi:MAG: UvrD-helicase domain-containing protein, partial [Flavobacteriaceae bacterium]
VTQSFIVQAPAGSGKTELLTQRYLKLLSVCDEPENVMAMTFTKKGVSEIIERVLSALQSTSRVRPKEPHKQKTYDLAIAVLKRSKQRGWQLLQTPERIKISTIDGLSSRITRSSPKKEQLATLRILAQDWEREKAYQFAAEQTLLMINDEDHKQDISSVLLYLNNNIEKFYRLITSMLSRRDQWLGNLCQGDIKLLKNSSKEVIIQHLTLLGKKSKYRFDKKFFDLLSINDKFGYIKVLPINKIEDLEKWKDIARLCLTKDKKPKWRKTVDKRNGFLSIFKEQKHEFIEILKSFGADDNLRELLSEVLLLPDPILSEMESDILIDVIQVLKLSVVQLNLYFEREQVYDFIEVSFRADSALDARFYISDTVLHYEKKVIHILIDEFQDTSSFQFSLIRKLIQGWQIADGKTLFIVGDPMQSIYRFRGSMVRLFLQTRDKGVANVKLKPLMLSTNFRSSKSIIDGNNTFFSCIFPNQENIDRDAINYLPSQPYSDVENTSAITFYPFLHKQHQVEAISVSKIVTNFIKDPEKMDKNIAILVRKRKHLKDIITELEGKNIAFEASKTSPLKDHILTKDLLSLTKALLHLGDKLAWLSVLRAPWCGLLLEDLLVF